MPDVGILNLQIHDDSAKAAEGLSKLVAKLGEMKDAASKIRLGTVATGIKRINDELSKVQPSAIYKLKQLADVLEKIGSVSGNVGGIRISFGGRGQNAEDMAAQLQAARDAVAQTTAGFEQIGQRVQEDVQGAEAFANTMGRVNEIVQQTGWTAQATAEQFAQMFQVMNSIRMSRALGGGASPFALGDGTGGSGAGWTYWKDGAIEVEGTVTDAMEAIGVGAGEAIPLLTGVVDATDEIASSVQEMANGSKSFINTAPGFNDVAQSVQSAAGGVQRYYNSLEDAFNGIRHGQKIENDLMSKWLHGEGTEREKLYAVKTMATQFGMSTDDVRAKIAELMAAENELTGAAQETTDAMNGINGAADEQKKSLKELIIGSNGLNGAFKRMFPTISGLLSRFKQLVKYRMLRAVIKQIAEGFREGTENYYRYSQAIGGEFATKMDNAATALLQMKNSIGAAAAPLISSLIPYLQMAVDWFINLVNYANQFFSLLTGQSEWTRAIPTTAEAFADTAKNAGSAGQKIKEAKDLLADWDELNIIQQEASNGSGGGSGGASKTAEDYKNMFEQVGSFSEGVERLVNFIEDHLGGVLGLAETIGAAILGWKISQAFEGVLGRIGKLIAGGALLVLGVELSYGAGYEAGKKGYFDGADILTTIGGWLSSALGGYLIGTSIAGPGGGMFGAVIGLTIGIATTLVGWIQGKERGRRESMWGDLSKTRDEIEGDVKSQFTFDVEAEINVMKAQVAKQAEARRNVRIAFNQFAASVQNLKVGIDVGIDVNKQEELVNQAYTDYLTLCSDLQNMITTRQEGVDLLVKTFKFTDSEGNDITQSTIESLKFADKTVMDYFTDLGDEMAGWIYKGEQSGWKNREAEQIYALMESQRNIVARAEEARLDQEKKTKIRTGLYGVTDLGTAETTFEVQKQYLKDWENEAKQLVDAEIADAAYMAELAHGAWEDAVSKYGIDSEQARELKAAEDRNLAFIEQMSNEDEYRKAINAKLEPTKKVFAEEWASTLRTVFGEQIDFNVDLLNANNLHFTQLFDGRTMQEAGLQFRKYIEDQVGEIDPLLKEIMTEFGIDTWDMIGDEAKKSMIRNLLGFADENQVKEILTYAFGNLSEETQELVHQTAEEMKNLSALGAESGLSGFNEVLDAKKRQKLTVPMQDFAAYGSDVLEMGSYKGFTNVDSFRDWKRNGMPGMEELLIPEAIEYDLEVVTDSSMSEPIEAPAIDQTNFVSSLESMYESTRSTVLAIIRMLSSIGGAYSSSFSGFSSYINAVNVQPRASGGYVRSGDLVMANENGNFEMMGRMGNQPVVANNNQIVTGISQGVSNANGEMVGEMRNMETLMRKMLNKEFVAKAVPSSGWGRNNAQSAEAYDRVTGG